MATEPSPKKKPAAAKAPAKPRKPRAAAPAPAPAVEQNPVDQRLAALESNIAALTQILLAQAQATTAQTAAPAVEPAPKFLKFGEDDQADYEVEQWGADWHNVPPQPRSAKWIRNLRNAPVHLRLYGPNKKEPYRIALNPRGQSGDAERVPGSVQGAREFIQGHGILFEIITEAEANDLRSYYPPVGYTATHQLEVIRPQDDMVTLGDEWDGSTRQAPLSTRTTAQLQPRQYEELDRLHGHAVPDHTFQDHDRTQPNYVNMPGADERVTSMYKRSPAQMAALAAQAAREQALRQTMPSDMSNHRDAPASKLMESGVMPDTAFPERVTVERRREQPLAPNQGTRQPGRQPNGRPPGR